MSESRVRLRRVLLPALLLAVLPVAASGSTPFERVGAVTLESGEEYLASAVSDGTHAYFGTSTDPGRVVKVNLATMQRVGAVTLEPGEGFLHAAVSDGTHAYFGTSTEPGRVVKVNLATMQRVGAVTLEPGENVLWSAVSDGTHAYFGTSTDPGRVVKVNLATMQRVGAVTLEPGEGFLHAAVSDGTHAYFGTDTNPGRVVKVNLATMQRVGAVTLDGGESYLGSAVSDGTHAYFGTVAQVVKVNLATMQRVGAVTRDEGVGHRSAVSDGTHTYFGTYTSPGRVVKVGLGLAVVDAPSVAVPPSVSCAPLPALVGARITCTVTGGDAGIDILWRAAYNPVLAGEGVTLDASGSGEFSFTVPAAALGQELTVELVEWTAPVSLGVVGGPAPSSVPSGEGPVDEGLMSMWRLGLLALVAFGLLRRGMRAQA
jgi:uncharacterized protein GlcG (DUF336 family)